MQLLAIFFLQLVSSNIPSFRPGSKVAKAGVSRDVQTLMKLKLY